MKTTIIFLFFLSSFTLKAEYLGDLLIELDTAKLERKSAILYQLGAYYAQFNMDSANYYASQIDKEYSKSKNLYVLSQKSCLLTEIYMAQNNFDSTYKYYNVAISQLTQLKRYNELANILTSFGTFCKNNSLIENSIEQYLKSIKILKKLNDSAELARAYYSLYVVYESYNATPQILEYLDLAMLYYNNREPFGTANIMNGYASYYSKHKIYDKALKYLKYSDSIFYKYKLFAAATVSASQLIELYINSNNLAAVEPLIKKTNEFNKEHSLIPSKITYWIQCGIYYKLKKDYKESKKYYSMINQSIKDFNDFFTLKLYYAYSKDLFKELKEHDKSLEYAEKLLELNDSLYNQNMIAKTRELNINFQISEKNDKIRLLEQDNRIQTLMNEKSNSRLLLLASILIALASLAFLFIMLYFNKKRQNNELSQLNSDLKELNSTKDKFFSIIAHDLKNPLFSFTSILEILNREFDTFDDTERVEILKELEESSNSILSLLQNLLIWSNIQRNKFIVNFENIRIYDLINHNIELCRLNSRQKQIQINNNISEDVVLQLDLNMMNLVIRNLLTNSIKYTREGGRIDFNVKVNNNSTVISITDSGVGMSAKTLENLFLLDKNISQPGTNDERGTGLGLILCKEFMQINKGRIWAESEENVGSTFYLEFNN